MEGTKILIVDDEGYIGDLIVDFLALENIKGVKSEDFITALEIAGSEKFDLILSDVNIGNESIEDFLSSLKQNRIDTPVVLMTGDHRIDNDFTLKAGAIGIMYKPFQISPFLSNIKKFLEKS